MNELAGFELPADPRLVVTDMDGTLLDGDGEVPDGLWEVLGQLEARGIAFAPASGRQLASRAAATVADHLLSSGGVHRLELGARANNPASLRVARAAGFIQEGVEREKFVMDGTRVDVLTFGRLRSDPFPAIAALELEPAPGEA